MVLSGSVIITIILTRYEICHLHLFYQCCQIIMSISVASIIWCNWLWLGVFCPLPLWHRWSVNHSFLHLCIPQISCQLFALFCLDNGKEILSMNEVLNFLLRSSRPLLEETELANMLTLDENEWQNTVDEVRGMIVTYPGMVWSDSAQILNRCQSEGQWLKVSWGHEDVCTTSAVVMRMLIVHCWWEELLVKERTGHMVLRSEAWKIKLLALHAYGCP